MQGKIIHAFGSAPQVVPQGYTLKAEVQGTAAEIGLEYADKDVVLVSGGGVFGKDGVLVIGVFGPASTEVEVEA